MKNREVYTEKELLSQIVTGNQASFTVLFERYSKIIYPFALKLTRSETLAEEILQEVFLKIWVNRENLLQIENFGAYLNRITRNHAYNVLRQIAYENLQSVELRKQISEVVYTTENEVAGRDIEQSLNNAIDHLTPQQKLIYTLCHQKGLKYNEVANRLNISSSTVHTHMKLALKFIRSYFIQLNTIITLYFILR